MSDTQLKMFVDQVKQNGNATIRRIAREDSYEIWEYDSEDLTDLHLLIRQEEGDAHEPGWRFLRPASGEELDADMVKALEKLRDFRACSVQI